MNITARIIFPLPFRVHRARGIPLCVGTSAQLQMRMERLVVSYGDVLVPAALRWWKLWGGIWVFPSSSQILGADLRAEYAS